MCHSGDCPPCPLLPDLRGVCPCGKTSLASLGITRESCLDDIPTCDLICGKLLSCGNASELYFTLHIRTTCWLFLFLLHIDHICMSRCHHGDCPECTGDQKILCRCKQTTAVSIMLRWCGCVLCWCGRVLHWCGRVLHWCGRVLRWCGRGI